MIIYVSKNKLYPAFGYAWPEKGLAHVRADLPTSVKNFVTVHEEYHLHDKAKWWVWREIKANWAGFKKHPIGCIYCILLSLSWARIQFYIQRIKKGA